MKLSKEEREYLNNLRNKGFVVVTFSPEEYGKTDQETLEAELVNYGEQKIIMDNPED